MVNKHIFPHSRGSSFLILILSSLGLLVSVITEIQKYYKNKVFSAICGALPNSSCDAVQGSIYGRIFGIDLPILGILFFSALVVLSLLQLKDPDLHRGYLLLAGCLASGFFALWLLFVQAFILKAYCVYCLIVDTSSLVLLGTALLYLFKYSHSSRKK